MKAVLNWLDTRTGYKHLLQEALYEPIPGGARWRYVWGSTLTFVFVTQVITGFFLWSAYSPSTQSAWESVNYIQNEMAYGWLVRGIHHFAAQAMMILLALHFFQVVIDGAYKAPREVNFWLGLVLLQIVLGLSLTGYLLPWDQKGYYATQVATNIAGVTPVIGSQIQQIAQGGSTYGHQTLTRFFALHAGVLPTLLVVFLVLHIAVFRRHGIKAPDKYASRPAGMFWPDQVLKDAIACLAVLATILFFVVYKKAELSSPADPAEAYSAPRPEWYFLFLFRFLKFEEIDKLGLAFGAIYIPGLVFTIIALMPFIGKWKLGHRFNVAFTFGLLLGASYLTVLALREDAADPDYRAAVAEAHRDSARAVDLVRRDGGAPTEGALSLLKSDPLTQGPRLFARHCASCHRYEGHDGTGRQIVVSVGEAHSKKTEIVPATAPDLGTFGTRAWTKDVLTNYHELFAPLKNMVLNDKNVGERFLTGDMANWVTENKAALTDPANEADLNALVEYLAELYGPKDEKPVDADLAAKGKDIYASGKLKSGALSMGCADCHDPGNGAPLLVGYGGKDWLKRFILNPGHADFYGDNNAMVQFEGKLSPGELDLLVNWMIGDYYRAPEKKTAH
ncbi:MAG TPA: cytochrome b N-terminal domain-containing protein [Planctomycetaceae bacterium]|nr:cytochrome b N-terminal domain-containing protein [Planctomycetaceae bacterium]